MSFFSIFKNISNDSLKKNADKGYENESIEMGYRYLYGKEGIKVSIEEAQKYLKPILEKGETEHLPRVKLMYVIGLLSYYVNSRETQEGGLKYLEEVNHILNAIVSDEEFKIDIAEQIKIADLLKKAIETSNNFKPLEKCLKMFLKVRGSHFAAFQLAHLYRTGEEGFPQKPKLAILYYIKALFRDENSVYGENREYGVNRNDYMSKIMKLYENESNLGSWLLLAMLVSLNTAFSNPSEELKRVKIVLDQDVIKDYFKNEVPKGTDWRGHLQNEKITREEFLMVSLKHDPCSTVALIGLSYKENLISEAVFSELQYKMMELKEKYSVPHSQIDKLHFCFFANRYSKRDVQKDKDIETRKAFLMELAETTMLVSNENLSEKKLCILSEFVMNLIITEDPDCIAKARQLYEKYGEKINQYQDYNEGGLIRLLEKKEEALYQLKNNAVKNLFVTVREQLKKFSKKNDISLISKEVWGTFLNNLDQPELFISKKVNDVFDKDKISLLFQSIESLKEDFKVINTTVSQLMVFKERFASSEYKQLIQEIEKASLSAITCQNLTAMLLAFKEKLDSYNSSNWENKMACDLERLEENNHENRSSQKTLTM